MDIMSRIPAGTEKDPAFPIKDPASLSPWFSSTGGFLFHLWSRRINPEAILLFIQPFADVVGNYACQNGEDKRYCRIVHEGHPLSVPVSGVVAV